jgi:hypothetical protein
MKRCHHSPLVREEPVDSLLLSLVLLAFKGEEKASSPKEE